MIRLKYKRLEAVCLSICLTASQSMISVPAYAQQAMTVEAQPEDGAGMKEADSGLGEARAGLASPSSAGHGESRDGDAAEDSGSQADTFGGSEEGGDASGGSVRDGSTGEELVQEAERVAPQADGALLPDETTAAQITDWQWVDPAHELTDGVLSLSDVNPDNQADFDTVVSKLPKKLLATVWGTAAESDVDTATGSNAKTDRQKEITLDGWSCDTFQTDRGGNWPTAGAYTFEAHLTYGGGVYPF